MKARIKKPNKDGIVRLETEGRIMEVLVNEELSEEEKISICFRGKESSGIIELTTKELEGINRSLKERTHLIKDMKIIR